jgi:hypothetical protein
MSARDQLLAALASTIGDLSLAKNTDSKQLYDAANVTLAAIKTGQEIRALDRNSSSRERLSKDPLIQRLLDQAVSSQLPTRRVRRRTLGPPFSIDPNSTTESGQLVTSSFGPFHDGFGRLVGIDVLVSLSLIAFQRKGAAAPFLYLDIPARTGTGSVITFNSGSVWIPVDQLVAGQPATSYVGLSVQSGSLTLPVSVNLGAQPVTVPGTGDVGLSLTLTQQPSPSPGAPPFHGNPSFSVPSTVDFTFTPGGPVDAKLASAGSAAVSAWGSSVELGTLNFGLATYSDTPPRVEFFFNPSQTSFSIAEPDSGVVNLEGTAEILGASWFLPIVTTTDPGSLAAASGAGGVSLSLGTGLLATPMSTGATVNCGPCTLLVEPGLLELVGSAGSTPNTPQLITLSQNSSVTSQTPTPFKWDYVSLGGVVEGWIYMPMLVFTLDQPRTINNDRARLAGPGLIGYALDGQGVEGLLVSGTSATNVDSLSTQSYALKNLLLAGTSPKSVSGFFNLTNWSATSGILTTSFDLRFAVPFLPDPYTTNYTEVYPLSDTTPIGSFQTIVSSQFNQPSSIDVNISLSSPSSSPSNTTTLFEKLTSVPLASTATEAENLLLLLDLSTNVSQFGVGISTNSGNRTARELITPTTAVKDLMLQAPGNEVVVLTLPAVQWEPIITPVPTLMADGVTLYPSPLSFPNSGQLTALATESVTLVPVTPREAIDNLIASYNAYPSSNTGASFTLPFGITALAKLAKTKLLSVSPPGMGQAQPTFSASNLTGGDQISITGERENLVVTGQRPSPYLPGTAVQTANALTNSGPTSITVLTTPAGDFTSTFNTQFQNFVPLTRIDISGFGESVFSDWRDVRDVGTFVSKVQFDVMVGRTAREVVQIVSTLYPFAVRVVRTITIERTNAAIVVRHDSGWQATSDGAYSFPGTAITTHPGVVKGVTNTINIRDLGSSVEVDSISLSAVTFDCDVTMEGVTLGQSSNGVPAKNLTGYVQATGGNPLTADQYGKLLSQVGSMGGAIDCSINIGGSGKVMRVSQIGVGASQGTGGPEFAMAAWGTPIFPTGEWSFVVQRLGGGVISAIPEGVGVPLIREGPAPQAPPASNPYRFADPAHLLIANPFINYALCFSMTAARIAFFRPKIEDTSPWAFTSDVAPLLADPFALGTTPSNGPFPSVSLCIPFNDALYQILIGSKGDLQLQLSPTSNTSSFTPAVSRRVLLESQNARIVAETSDENSPPNPSLVTITINSAASPTWSLSITNLSLIGEVPSMASNPSDPSSGEVTRTVGDVVCQQGSSASFQTPRLVFGPVMQPLKDSIEFFEKFGYTPAPEISITNKWKVDEKIGMKLDDFLAHIPVVGAVIAPFLDDLDYYYENHLDGALAYTEVEMELGLKFPFVGVFLWVLQGKFQYHVGTDGTTVCKVVIH